MHNLQYTRYGQPTSDPISNFNNAVSSICDDLKHFSGSSRERSRYTWRNVAVASLQVIETFPTGVTRAVLVSEIRRTIRCQQDVVDGTFATLAGYGKVEFETVLYGVIKEIHIVAQHGCRAIILTISDESSEKKKHIRNLLTHSTSPQNTNKIELPTVEMYLHRRFEYLIDTPILSKAVASSSDNIVVTEGQRAAPTMHSDGNCAHRIKLTGCQVTRTADGKRFRLLPSDFTCIEINTRSSVPDSSSGHDHSQSQDIQYIVDNYTNDSLSRLSPDKDVHVLAQVRMR